MKLLFGKYWRETSIALLGVLMFFVYAWFSWSTTTTSFYSCDSPETVDTELCRRYGDPNKIFKFNSPDENANFYWTLRVANGMPMQFVEPLETVGNNLIRPRSVAVLNDKVGIGSFLGMPMIYGSLAQVFTVPGVSVERFILYLTAVFAVLGVWFFYLLIAKVFDKNTAFLSALLMYVFPGWVYFANRAMYHNVLFVSLLIIGVYFFVRAIQGGLGYVRGKKIWRELFLYGISGVFVGLALITRTSEIGWVILLLFVLLLTHRGKFIPVNRRNVSHWLGLLFFSMFLAVSFVPVFVTNFSFYGAPISFGYSTGFSGELSDIINQRGLLFNMLVSPFGVHPQSILTNSYNYLVLMFPFFSIPVLVGFVVWAFSKRGVASNRKQWGYLLCVFLISCYLLVFYGSWKISDRIDLQNVSIGTSYVRYWLPIYLGMLPFLAYGMIRLVGITARVWARPVIIGLFVLLMAVSGFRLVFNSTDESLMLLRSNIRDTQGKYLKLQENLPRDSIVVLGFKQADKIFFPQHSRIITELAVPRDYVAVRDLADYTNLYYYHFAPRDTIDYISKRDFEPYGLRIVGGGVKIFGDERLYRMKIIEDIDK